MENDVIFIKTKMNVLEVITTTCNNNITAFVYAINLAIKPFRGALHFTGLYRFPFLT